MPLTKKLSASCVGCSKKRNFIKVNKELGISVLDKLYNIMYMTYHSTIFVLPVFIIQLERRNIIESQKVDKCNYNILTQIPYPTLNF